MASKKHSKSGGFLQEYGKFLKEYLFPLVGIIDNNTKPCNKLDILPPASCTIYQNNENRIFFSNGKQFVLYLDYSRQLSEDNRLLSMNVVQIFGKVSEYCPKDDSIQHTYYSDVQRDGMYKLAIEKGICNWVLGTENNSIEELLYKLERWSVQTYEGKKVTFGFLINPDIQGRSPKLNWLELLNDDMSAAFTDCIHSVIELDQNCNFYRYHSLSENDIFEECALDGCSPLRFNNVITKYVRGKVVGVFLLNNGDILIAKNGSVQMVKRNMRWLNLSFEAFLDTVKHYAEKSRIRQLTEKDELLKGIFVSILDVSFSHLGGIIAVVGDKWPGSEPKHGDSVPLLDPCDNLIGAEPGQDYRKEKKLTESEFQKRIQKRRFLQCLIDNQPFEKIDRKLRCEMISLDGACIMDCEGRVNAFGAIIRNESGSTAGGRGAAAKTLSAFGLAAKVSTDGYIELYIDGKVKYSIK